MLPPSTNVTAVPHLLACQLGAEQKAVFKRVVFGAEYCLHNAIDALHKELIARS